MNDVRTSIEGRKGREESEEGSRGRWRALSGICVG